MSGLDRFSLSDKAILITGATGYLGRAIAWAVAEAGGHVLVNSRSSERCARLVAELEGAGRSAETASFDVSDEKAVTNFFDRRGALPLHGLINNAYAGGAGTIETAESAQYFESYGSSVVPAHNLMRAALPSLRQAVAACGDASVINIASMYGIVSPDLRTYESPASSNPPFYGAAKAALLHWTRYAACEFGREGIRVNAISPGPFPNPAVQQQSPDFVTRLAGKVPLGRIGQSHEIQGAIILLASSASSFMNGANLTIDGGWTIW